MRPSKHATHSQRNAQNIFEISVTLARRKHNSIPLLATSETGVITLFWWNQHEQTCQSRDISHAPIETKRDVPSISNTWNWSRRIGLAVFEDFVYAIYKRAEQPPPDKEAAPAQLTLYISQLGANEIPVHQQTIAIPMPIYILQ